MRSEFVVVEILTRNGRRRQSGKEQHDGNESVHGSDCVLRLFASIKINIISQNARKWQTIRHDGRDRRFGVTNCHGRRRFVTEMCAKNDLAHLLFERNTDFDKSDDVQTILT